jgi:type II secretory pathway component GspD/PulD (secretin)
MATAARPAQMPGTIRFPVMTGLHSAIKPPPFDPRKAKQLVEKGQRAEKEGNWKAAFAFYTQAAENAPDVRDYAFRRDFARGKLVQNHADRAELDIINGKFDDARAELRAGLALNPSDRITSERLLQLAAATPGRMQVRPSELSGQIRLHPQPGVHSFDYRGTTQGAYEQVAQQFGVKVAFDVDLSSRPVRFRVSDVDFETAMRLLGKVTDTFWRPMNTQMFFVAQDTSEKRRQYDAMVLRTVLLPNSATNDQMTEVFRVVRDIAEISHADLDTSSRSITIRDTPEKVELAAKLISQLDLPSSEVILEIEILEVDRNLARNLGIAPPTTSRIVGLSQQQLQEAQQSVQGLVDVLTQLFGQPSSLSGVSSTELASLLTAGQVSLSSLIPPLIAFGGGRSTFFATMPGATANFSNALSLVKSGRRILLRAMDGKPASFFVGDRFPVSLAQFSASLGSSTVIPGVFQNNFPRTDFSVGASPVAVATGTFNSNTDSHIDIAAVNQDDNTLSILIGDGAGTFTAATGSPIAVGTRPAAIVTGKFNSNSTTDTTDLAVTNFNCTGTPLVCGPGSLTILLGNGDGTFSATPASPATGAGPVALVAGTFNANNPADHTDLAVVNQVDNTVSILLGNGDGTFTPVSGNPLATGTTPVAIISGKFNSKNTNDHTDLAVVNQGDNTVSIFLANGDGTFTLKTTLATGNQPTSITTSDFNADGFADLAVANFADNTVSIFLGNGDGTFSTRVDFPTGTGPSGIVANDFNADSRPDLAVAGQTANTASILIGLGDGTFAPSLDLPTGSGPVALATDDFNVDSLPDLVLADKLGNAVTVLLNTNTFNGSTGLPQTAFPGVEYIDLGLKVKATARIHPQNDVTLKMEFEIRSLSGVAVNGIPILSNRTIEQTVRLHVDETSILSGVMETDEIRAITGTPGLAGLGPAGLAVSNQTQTDTQTELLILMTPRLVRNPDRTSKSIYAGTGASSGPSAPSRSP